MWTPELRIDAKSKKQKADRNERFNLFIGMTPRDRSERAPFVPKEILRSGGRANYPWVEFGGGLEAT